MSNSKRREVAEVAGGLMEHVYGRAEGDALYPQTLPEGSQPVLAEIENS